MATAMATAVVAAAGGTLPLSRAATQDGANGGIADRVSRYANACDGSAIAYAGGAAEGGYFWNATDDDNTLRLYGIGRSQPVREVDLTAFLDPQRNKQGRPKEVDIEAVARVGQRLYWIGSHGNDSQGRRETSRERLFATELQGSGAESSLEPVGIAFRDLRAALLRLPDPVGAALAAAVKRAPDSGGLNIEALAAGGTSPLQPSPALLIGLRSPLVEGLAVVLPLANAHELVERGATPVFGNAWLLDLGGRGVRALEPVGSAAGNEYWVLAGAPGAGGTPAIYRWRPGNAPRAVPLAAWLASVSGRPEGLMRTDDGRLLVSLDDGDLDDCKTVAPAARHFRLIRME